MIYQVLLITQSTCAWTKANHWILMCLALLLKNVQANPLFKLEVPVLCGELTGSNEAFYVPECAGECSENIQSHETETTEELSEK